jgi:hypothetical protein
MTGNDHPDRHLVLHDENGLGLVWSWKLTTSSAPFLAARQLEEPQLKAATVPEGQRKPARRGCKQIDGNTQQAVVRCRRARAING